MSKKNKKPIPTRKPVPARSQSAARPAAAKGRSHPHKETTHINLLAVRIATGIVAALCLAGIVALLVTQSTPYAPAIVIEVVLLALITGFCVFTAIRPRVTLRWFGRLTK